jgi:hypothetical protein
VRRYVKEENSFVSVLYNKLNEEQRNLMIANNSNASRSTNSVSAKLAI